MDNIEQELDNFRHFWKWSLIYGCFWKISFFI